MVVAQSAAAMCVCVCVCVCVYITQRRVFRGMYSRVCVPQLDSLVIRARQKQPSIMREPAHAADQVLVGAGVLPAHQTDGRDVRGALLGRA